MHEVTWLPSAFDDLATICLDHRADWSRINKAEREISSKLALGPMGYSNEVSEGLRRIISSPLAIYFSMQGDQVFVDAVGWVVQ